MKTEGAIDAVSEALRDGQAKLRRLRPLARAPTHPGATPSFKSRRSDPARLDALQETLHGPDTREALVAMFPDGLKVRATPDAFIFEADGVVPIDSSAGV